MKLEEVRRTLDAEWVASNLPQVGNLREVGDGVR